MYVRIYSWSFNGAVGTASDKRITDELKKILKEAVMVQLT
jgi:hypothetical protein